MSPAEIQAAYARANEVIDGFKQPSIKNARDVVSLLRHFSSQDKAKQAGSDGLDFLKDVFGFK